MTRTVVANRSAEALPLFRSAMQERVVRGVCVWSSFRARHGRLTPVFNT